jgi:two-component system response regulator CssR
MFKICLVEDEKNLNNLIKNYLEHEGYNVIPKYNGKDTYEIIGKEKIDLWILDIMLGDDISGYDLIKKIREIDIDVPVIFTSARDQDLDKIIGLELGSDDYITKPYSPKELILRVNKLINRIYKENWI